MRLGGAPEALEVVVVDEGDEIGAAERGGHHDRLPGRAFLHLAVAQHRVDDAAGLAAALRQRHADRRSTDRDRASPSTPRCRDCRSRGGSRAGPPTCSRGRDPGGSARPCSSRITYWIMQPWPFDMTKVSGDLAVGEAAHQAVVDAVDDFRAGIGRADVQRADLLGDIEDAPAEAQAARTCGSGIERVAQNHVVHRSSPRSAKAGRDRPSPEYRPPSRHDAAGPTASACPEQHAKASDLHLDPPIKRRFAPIRLAVKALRSLRPLLDDRPVVIPSVAGLVEQANPAIGIVMELGGQHPFLEHCLLLGSAVGIDLHKSTARRQTLHLLQRGDADRGDRDCGWC